MAEDVSNDVALQLYETMQRIRSFETAVIELFARGKIPGFLHTYVGEEAIAAGVCANLRPDDKIISTHRGHGHLIAKGGRLDLMMAELFGKRTGYCKGKGGSMHIAEPDLGMLGANAIVGAGTAIINGAALTAQYLGKDEVAVAFFGDGASNTGSFHEAMNMAAVWNLPTIFVCENNAYAESTPQTYHQKIKDKKISYSYHFNRPIQEICKEYQRINALKTGIDFMNNLINNLKQNLSEDYIWKPVIIHDLCVYFTYFNDFKDSVALGKYALELYKRHDQKLPGNYPTYKIGLIYHMYLWNLRDGNKEVFSHNCASRNQSLNVFSVFSSLYFKKFVFLFFLQFL